MRVEEKEKRRGKRNRREHLPRKSHHLIYFVAFESSVRFGLIRRHEERHAWQFVGLEVGMGGR